MKQNGQPANIINHVALVLDASSSMDYYGHDKKLIAVVDDQIKYLARRSKELDQETRVTVYTFADKVQCVIYDKDVLRLPSIREHYRAYGNTALVDAAMLAIEDLKLTATKYGDHSFLIYVLTDGEENRSRSRASDLALEIKTLPDNWTVACLVPDPDRALPEAKRQGFPANNIAVWNTQRKDGVMEAGLTIRNATDAFMTGRASGLRGTRNLFTPQMGNLTSDDIANAGLTPVDPSKYVLIPVVKDTTIKEFVEECASQYQVGKAFYQLTGSKVPGGKKFINVQGNKAVAVMDKDTSKVYTGPEARKLVGLPDHDVRVDPTDDKGQYRLFVQSTSTNRHLYAGTKLLLMTG